MEISLQPEAIAVCTMENLHPLKDHNIIALIMEVIITETAIQTPDTHSYMYKLISSISFEHFSKIRDIKFS